jgi:hypothetical protein
MPSSMGSIFGMKLGDADRNAEEIYNQGRYVGVYRQGRSGD